MINAGIVGCCEEEDSGPPEITYPSLRRVVTIGKPTNGDVTGYNDDFDNYGSIDNQELAYIDGTPIRLAYIFETIDGRINEGNMDSCFYVHGIPGITEHNFKFVLNIYSPALYKLSNDPAKSDFPIYFVWLDGNSFQVMWDDVHAISDTVGDTFEVEMVDIEFTP